MRNILKSALIFRHSILAKMIAVFLILIIVPAFVIGFVSTTTASRSVIKKAEENVQTSTMQTSKYFDLVMDKAENLTIQILSSPVVQTYLSDLAFGADTLTKSKDLNEVMKFLVGLSPLNNSNYDIAIFLYDGNVIGQMVKFKDPEEAKASEWHKKVTESSGRPVWINGFFMEETAEQDAEYGVILLRELKATKTG